MKYVIYWIRKKDHNDITTQGYVGVTSNITRRLNQHRKYTNTNDNPHLKHALQKYDDIIVDIIFEGLEEQCLLKEQLLRPTKLIGWNIAEGGGIPPKATGKKWTEQRREKYFETITNNNSNYRTPEQRRRGIITRDKNGFKPGAFLDPQKIKGTRWWTNGSINKRSHKSPGINWFEGRTKFKKYGTIKICPHCKKQGKGSGMTRFHFNNCKENKI